MPKTRSSKVAAYLASAIDKSPKTQAQIAEEAEFPRSNIVSMLKMGTTKLPIARIPALAKSLEIDPVELYRLAMEEYMPEMLTVNDMVYGRDKLNAGETELLRRLRFHTDGKSFRLNAEANSLVDDLAGVIIK